nr:hypothetical protein [Deltaproteobacteria bacterium]
MPTDDHVVTLITQLLEFRRRIDDARRVLFLVDDLDLLDPRLENGGECSVLLDRLGTLAASKRCTVVVTVRTQSYNGREKDLQPLAESGPEASFNDGGCDARLSWPPWRGAVSSARRNSREVAHRAPSPAVRKRLMSRPNGAEP